MKRFKTFLVLCGVAVLMTVACEKAAPESTMKEDGVEFNIMALMPGMETKVTDTAFEANDNIGVYVVENEKSMQLAGNMINNAEFVYDGSSWAAARKQFWNNGIYDVYAYYPYMSIINDINDCIFSVQTDQSSSDGYEKSDFLWAKASGVQASSSPVKLTFSHKLSRVIVQLEKSDTYEGEIPDNCEVFIHNTVVDALIDLSTGDVAKNSYGEARTIKARKINALSFDAILVPQLIQTRTPLVEVVVDNVSYIMEGMLSFKPGYSVTLVVTLDKNPEQTKIEIGGSVGGWN